MTSSWYVHDARAVCWLAPAPGTANVAGPADVKRGRNLLVERRVVTLNEIAAAQHIDAVGRLRIGKRWIVLTVQRHVPIFSRSRIWRGAAR